MSKEPRISIVIPILEAYHDFASLNAAYLNELSRLSEPYELIYVQDVESKEIEEIVVQTIEAVEFAKSIKLSHPFGDSTALRTGIQSSVGERILVLPAHRQVMPEDVISVLEALDRSDMAVGERNRFGESALVRMQGWLFNRALSSAAPELVKDMGCELVAFNRSVASELAIYGDQHRYLPVLAHRIGFEVVSVEVRQSPDDVSRKRRRMGDYLHSILDVLNVVFLSRFTKKPLRFFGLIGLTMVAIGTAMLSFLVVERVFFEVALASRPALVMASLMLVVGLQVLGIGLIGEIIIFSRARDLPDYHIRKIYDHSSDGDVHELVSSPAANPVIPPDDQQVIHETNVTSTAGSS